MFGFLNPRPHTRSYRQTYARLCQIHRHWAGTLALPFHSYEAVFLFQWGQDAGLVDAECLPKGTCCKLARGKVTGASDETLGRLCSSFATTLLATKLADDVRDFPKWHPRNFGAKIFAAIYRKSFLRAKTFLHTLDPQFTPKLDALIRDHHRLENPQAISLERYAEPTSLAFGYVFGLASKIRGLETYKDALTRTGQHIGSALIAFDCAVDWLEDRKKGDFNPLQDEQAVREAMTFAGRQLSAAVEVTETALGSSSGCVATLEQVRNRVSQRNPFQSPLSCPVPKPLSIRRFIPLPIFASNGEGMENRHRERDVTGHSDGIDPNTQYPQSPEQKKDSGSGGGGNNCGCCEGITCCILPGECCECCCAAGACA